MGWLLAPACVLSASPPVGRKSSLGENRIGYLTAKKKMLGQSHTYLLDSRPGLTKLVGHSVQTSVEDLSRVRNSAFHSSLRTASASCGSAPSAAKGTLAFFLTGVVHPPVTKQRDILGRLSICFTTFSHRSIRI